MPASDAGREAVAPSDASGASPVPSFSSDAAYLASIHDLPTWRGVVDAVVERHGLRTTGEPVMWSNHKQPVILIPPDRVLKISVAQHGRLTGAQRELDGYRLLGGDPTLEVPQLVASGSLGPACRYLVVTRVDGRALGAVRDTMTDDDLVSIMTWVGERIGRIGAIPLDPTLRRQRYAEHVARIADAHAHTHERAFVRKDHLPPHLAEQLVDWMPSLPELIGSADADAVVIHGALRYAHIHVREVGGHHVGAGLIDLGATRVGHRLHDIIELWASVRTESPAAGEALLAAAGVRESGPELWRLALAWALVIRYRKTFRIADLASVATLDELAWRIFSPERPSEA